MGSCKYLSYVSCHINKLAVSKTAEVTQGLQSTCSTKERTTLNAQQCTNLHHTLKNPRTAPTSREAVRYEICTRWTKLAKTITRLCSVPTGHLPIYSIRVSGRTQELHTAEFSSTLEWSDPAAIQWPVNEMVKTGKHLITARYSPGKRVDQIPITPK